jgi:hypothetical protein
MIVAGSASPLLLASAGGYNLTRSLRLRQSASAYLARTPSVSGNRRTWTWSSWVKRGTLGSTFQSLFATSNGSTVQFYLGFGSDQLQTLNWAGSTQMQLITTSVYRDPSAWYHVVLAIDTTQATDTNRVKLYVNGVQVTSFGTASYPAQNLDIAVNALVPHAIGREEYSDNQWFDGYLAETYFIDGQQLTPSSFGATNASTGVWQPKKYAGTYGTNGFYLPFTDNSALTTSSNVGLGKDFSGNGNYWTTNNISITSGATYDSMTDVPTLTSATAANYCVINPLQKGTNSTISNANLTFSATGAVLTQALGSIYMPSGKYYWEVNVTTNTAGNAVFGAATASTNLNTGCGRDAFGWGYQPDTGTSYLWNNNSFTTAAADTRTGTFAVAFDADAGRLWFRNSSGNWISGDPAAGTSPSFSSVPSNSAPSISFTSGGSASVEENVNFGQRPFAYTPPTGYVALNTFNLPTPTIGATASTQAGKYEGIVTYTGNGASSRAITGLGFQPDMVWIKRRSTSDNHVLFDSVRVVSSVPQRLFPNLTNAEDGNFGSLDSFNSDGFTLGSNVATNANGETYVGWCWRANNGTNVTNTAGSITSTVSANTSAGFSVVTYTAQSSGTGTVGHGLGVAPRMIITKERVTAPSNWSTYHASLGNTAYLLLNTTNAGITASAAWNNTSPTSSVFTLGSAFAGAGTMVAYCFAPVAGYSAMGSYTGNGSSDGTFVYTGFRPRYILIKESAGSTGDWKLFDTARDPYNVSGNILFPNLSAAESTGNTGVDILSNGFKCRNSSLANSSGVTYIYACFAENPYKYSLAR